MEKRYLIPERHSRNDKLPVSEWKPDHCTLL